MKKLLKCMFTILFIVVPILSYAQCENDICEDYIELTLCFETPLSENCTGLFNSDENFVPNTICNDQWFNVLIPSVMNVTIILTSSGYEQGIRFITYYGESCDSLEVVFVSGSAISAGIECGDGIPTPSYILQEQWLPQNVGVLPDINAFCPYNLVFNVQNVEVVLTLIPGTYWFQVFPRTSNCITGTGTIEICANTFLELGSTEDMNINQNYETVIFKGRFLKILHPRFGLLLHDTYLDNFYDLRMRQVFIK